MGFPRPRGDGPTGDPDADASPTVPPPTRGWSAGTGEGAQPAKGSPAHAGMVPDRTGGLGAPAGFPRPRGDGPRAVVHWAEPVQVPPPTRGWSRGGPDRAQAHEGSPAHAGMVRTSPISVMRSCRFPRPRGDGPSMIGGMKCDGWVPPPTRGWSPLSPVLVALREGSPAHAGMVRTGACCAS